MIMKRKYFVDVRYEVILSTDTIAESEEEAVDNAIEKLTDVSLDTGEVTEEEGCVTDVEDIEEEGKEVMNPLSEAYSNLKSDLIYTLMELVREYGDRNTLETFQTEVELDNSSVDKVLYFPYSKDMYIVFDANSNDYADIGEFGVDDLVPFVTGLQKWFEVHGRPEE